MPLFIKLLSCCKISLRFIPVPVWIETGSSESTSVLLYHCFIAMCSGAIETLVSLAVWKHLITSTSWSEHRWWLYRLINILFYSDHIFIFSNTFWIKYFLMHDCYKIYFIWELPLMHLHSFCHLVLSDISCNIWKVLGSFGAQQSIMC